MYFCGFMSAWNNIIEEFWSWVKFLCDTCNRRVLSLILHVTVTKQKCLTCKCIGIESLFLSVCFSVFTFSRVCFILFCFLIVFLGPLNQTKLAVHDVSVSHFDFTVLIVCIITFCFVFSLVLSSVRSRDFPIKPGRSKSWWYCTVSSWLVSLFCFVS